MPSHEPSDIQENQVGAGGTSGQGCDAPDGTPSPLGGDHAPDGGLIIAGFGVIGRAVADTARSRKLPVTIVETNPRTITTQRGLGVRVVEGDIAEPEILEQAGIATASMLVLAIPDEDAVLRCCRIARAMRPDLCIIVRSRYMSLGMKAEAAGATRAVVEELATAIEMAKVVSGQLARRDA